MRRAINVQNLAKVFQLGTGSAREPYGTLRESLTSVARAPARCIARMQGRTAAARRPALWALKDVSFTVEAGESVGIIGRNGAGKSTLLKVLSRITAPTEGTADIRGRLGSLLEVGTGFHPELTGRENIYLNGAIMGMTRAEIARKFDQIVEFSEIGRFIDTPVKRYSSGMYVRLAFSVAAHADPDILLIDEVLAVGDWVFRRKCMDHAKRLRNRRATLLFVSHDMFAIKNLCPRAIYLAEGKVAFDGPSEKAIQLYEKDGHLGIAGWASKKLGRTVSELPVQIEGVDILDENGRQCTVFDHGVRMRINVRYQLRNCTCVPNFNVAFVRSDDLPVCNYNMAMDGFAPPVRDGRGAFQIELPAIKLVADVYAIHINVWDMKFETLLCAQEAGSFHVRDPLLTTDFGVFHEPVRWRMLEPAELGESVSAGCVV